MDDQPQTSDTGGELQLLADRHNAGECGDSCPLHQEDMHAWFGLSYANYLVLERTLLQAMPGRWQRRFVALLEELYVARGDLPDAYGYRVQPVDAGGRFVEAPLPHYRHAPRDLDVLRRRS